MKPQNRTYEMPKATNARPATTATATRLSIRLRKARLRDDNGYIIANLGRNVKGSNPKELIPVIGFDNAAA
jgi:hypothetical protein